MHGRFEMKRLRKVASCRPLVLLFVPTILLALLLHAESCGGCSVASSGREQLKRLISPDGAVDAVLLEVHTPSLVSEEYEVYVVRHGEWPTRDDLVVLADRCNSIDVNWGATHHLQVHYAARIKHFRNEWIGDNPLVRPQMNKDGNRTGDAKPRYRVEIEAIRDWKIRWGIGGPAQRDYDGAVVE